MTSSEFEKLLLQSESNTLDFKRQQYDFSNDSDGRKTAEFIKDIISFANTVRTESAYIVIGVDVKENGSKEYIGLSDHIDDSTFQQKISSKVFPVPKFSYSTIFHDNKAYGIFEIPISKYELPISSTRRLKGLEPGKFYFRQGSSNSEANGIDAIKISKWLESLPSVNLENSLFVEVNEIMVKITSNQQPLSVIITEVLKIAKNNNLNDLIEFCRQELLGYSSVSDNEVLQNHYRVNTIAVTDNIYEFRPHSTWDSRMVMTELKKYDGVFERDMFFPHSILKIEEILKELSLKPSLCTFESTANKFIDDPKFKDFKVYIYANIDNFENLYSNIKQRLIDLLIQVTQ